MVFVQFLLERVSLDNSSTLQKACMHSFLQYVRLFMNPPQHFFNPCVVDLFVINI